VEELVSSFLTCEKAFFRQARFFLVLEFFLVLDFFLVLELFGGEPQIPRLAAAL